MEGFSINTTQNVPISYEPAGIGNRILSSLIDILFKIAWLFISILITEYLNKAYVIKRISIPFAFVEFLFFIPVLVYDLLFEIFMHGQTPGKKMMKIKVLMIDGTQPGLSAYILRWLIGLLEFGASMGLLALLSVAISKKSQRIGDMAAGTTVVRIKPTISLQETILQQEDKAAHQKQFQYAQISLLNDSDVQIIKDALVFYQETKREDVLQKLAQKIKIKTSINTSLSDKDFLFAILQDYNYQING
ncbi:MAG: RDD family protein [Bacteroidetes bacterium]|nr:RDD family protein [Bacteroidota bacterium]